MKTPILTLIQALLLSTGLAAQGQEASEGGWSHRLGGQIIATRFFGEFALKDHHGPWTGGGFGFHDLIRLPSNRALLLRLDYTYHPIPAREVRPSSQPLVVDGVAHRGTIEAWSIVNLGADCRWYRPGSGGTGPYLGAGAGLSILGQDNLDYDTRKSLAHGGSVSAHLNLALGFSFNRHLDAELRLSLAHYGIWTSPAVSAVIYFRF